jgi:Malectin domain
MCRLSLFLVLALHVFAQAPGQFILPGDACFVNGGVLTSPATMEWGANFTCALAGKPAGDYQITFVMQEPDAAAKVGQRLFTIQINGAYEQQPIDLYQMAKLSPINMVFRTFLAQDGVIFIRFTALSQNPAVSANPAVVSVIYIERVSKDFELVDITSKLNDSLYSLSGRSWWAGAMHLLFAPASGRCPTVDIPWGAIAITPDGYLYACVDTVDPVTHMYSGSGVIMRSPQPWTTVF